MLELGSVGWREIPGYLALADAFVQPGAADDFNRYRLPSKLPEFLAMGRPVVLPDCNIGHDLVDGRSALLLSEGDGLEIAARVEQLLDDPELPRSAGRGRPQLRPRASSTGSATRSPSAASCAPRQRRRGVGRAPAPVAA